MRKRFKPRNIFHTKKHSTPPRLLEKIQTEIFSDTKITEKLRLVGVLNSETRLRILFALTKREFLCVGDLADVVRLDISAVSHQLAILRKNKLVKSNKRKKVVYYSLQKDLPILTNSLI